MRVTARRGKWAGAELNRRHADFQTFTERNHCRSSSIIRELVTSGPRAWSTVIDTRFGQRFGQLLASPRSRPDVSGQRGCVPRRMPSKVGDDFAAFPS